MKKQKERPVKERHLEHGPRMFAIWRGIERTYYSLIWLEHEWHYDDRTHKTTHQTLNAVHCMHVDPSGRVAYLRSPGSALQYVEATSTKNTPEDMEAYLRRRLLLFGGPAEAYELLGVQKPMMTAPEGGDDGGDPAKARELDELYVRASRLLQVDLPELRKRYEHLNRGLQAMNLRNRLRAKGHNV